MRSTKSIAVLAVCVLALGSLLLASQNKFGVADTRQVTFSDPIYVGNVLLPKGDYEVKHTMQGETHIMVFRQLHVKTPVEAEVKCSLVPLQKKADQTATYYTHNDKQEHVLSELVFKGDSAKHVF
jgi:hypothetical protein